VFTGLESWKFFATFIKNKTFDSRPKPKLLFQDQEYVDCRRDAVRPKPKSRSMIVTLSTAQLLLESSWMADCSSRPTFSSSHFI